MNEALTCPVKDKWFKTMEEEMEPMKSNQAWELVDLSIEWKAIRNKLVFKIKRKANEIIERYKVRLMAKGYKQHEGIYYKKTLLSIVRFTFIRIILSIVTSLDLELH